MQYWIKKKLSEGMQVLIFMFGGAGAEKGWGPLV